MGYRGKTTEQTRARELRAEGWTIKEIAAELGVSRASVSTWVRDVEVDPDVWARRVANRRDHGWEKRRQTFLAKQAAQAESDRAAATAWLGNLSDRDLFIAGIALYAGEGGKTSRRIQFANSDPRMIAFFLTWLRQFFDIDEARLRMRLYLHDGLDLDAANDYWSQLTGIAQAQFGAPYRAVPDPSIRRSKHPMGCPSVMYHCSRTHRAVMGLVHALLTSIPPSGVAQLAERLTVNQ